MRFHVALLLLGPSSLAWAAAEPARLKLHHRLYHPLAAEAPFTERGTVVIAGGSVVAFEQSASFRDDFNAFAEALSTVKDASQQLYQVALERPGDSAQSQWDISSVKVCHLPRATSETIHLHTLHTDDPTPHALDYFVSPTPHDGACPTTLSPFVSFARNVNTTVVMKGASFPPIPTLIAPPPLSPEGQPVQPVQERTFIQKYWMYILAVVVFALFTGGPEEEQQKKRQ